MKTQLDVRLHSFEVWALALIRNTAAQVGINDPQRDDFDSLEREFAICHPVAWGLLADFANAVWDARFNHNPAAGSEADKAKRRFRVVWDSR
ncbi:hypothetical protein DES53_102577 [Roseimicrobium gellanilyticum]|uniref:Uncharacterized protein n=1 Tax=Roseimicrobium gellanilyticum TaxID=748857 RepID=A0A366HR98_9BACT|nr:hypothetical protein DES53_102577 [Roseimicrobium gellanilyticum]